MKKKRVIIIGGGFAGLHAAKGLAKSEFDLVLIDKTNHHLFQPLLYQVAAAALSPANIAVPIREMLNQQSNCMVLMGEVVAIHKEQKTITLENGEMLNYDILVVSPGANHSYFGQDHWEKFAPGLKTVEDALKIRAMILSSFEKAERCQDSEEAQKFLNFAVIGGGPTGVEIAGALADIARRTMLCDFCRITPNLAKIYLVELHSHLLPSFPESLGIRAEKDLKHLGVQVITGRQVMDVSREGVKVDEEFIEAKNIVWAAGNQASSLLRSLQIPLNRQGQVKVNVDFSIPGYPEIFVIGDAAEAFDSKGSRLPAIAPAALQEGKWVAAYLRGSKRSFVYRDKGMLATIGRYRAVGIFGSHQMTGLSAWFAWGTVHIAYLVGFRNRFMVLTQWFVSLLTNRRSVRLLYYLKYKKKESPKKEREEL